MLSDILLYVVVFGLIIVAYISGRSCVRPIKDGFDKSHLYQHAKAELKDYSIESNNEVLELLRVFYNQGHSGCSASFVTEQFYKLAKFQPLRPLTGEDSEWIDVTPDHFQNNRCSGVFKNKKTGIAYFLDGRVFKDKTGASYTCSASKTPITFPCYPKTEYMDREATEEERIEGCKL
jgi:hypothetical protein